MTGRWIEAFRRLPDDPARPGVTEWLAEVERHGAEPLRIVVEASAKDMTPPWNAGRWPTSGLTATFRWSPGNGPADMELSWPVGGGAFVNDPELLLRNPEARWAYDVFMDALPQRGPIAGLNPDVRRDAAIAALRQLRADGKPLTQEEVANTLGRGRRTFQRDLDTWWRALLRDAGETLAH